MVNPIKRYPITNKEMEKKQLAMLNTLRELDELRDGEIESQFDNFRNFNDEDPA